MITKLYWALKKGAVILVLNYAIALSVASFMNIKDIPNIGVSNEDKIFHAVAYFLFALLMYNYLKTISVKRAILMAFITVVIYGIIIEVLQYVLTTHRTFDLYDAFANFIGALIASILLKIRHNRTLNLN